MKSCKLYIILFGILLFGLGTVWAQGGFNVEIELPEEYSFVERGDEIWFTVKVMNLESVSRMDITIEYSILDLEGNKMVDRAETVAIETQASFVGSIQVPEDIGEGEYQLGAEVQTVLGNYKATEQFSVSRKQGPWILISIIAGAVLVIWLIAKLISKMKRVMEKRGLRVRVRGIVRRRLTNQK